MTESELLHEATVYSRPDIYYRPVFEKTRASIQKNVKSHVFLDFEKKTFKNVKNVL